MSTGNFTINKNLKLPYYYQLYESLASSIQSDKFSEGQQLETEMELCRKFDVSRTTIRQALKELELNGYIIRERGKGTFVRKKIETHSLQKVSSIVDELREEGISTRKKIIQNEIAIPDERITSVLNLKDGEKIFFVKRLVFAFKKPLYLSLAYLPFSITGTISKRMLSENSFTKIITEVLNLRLVHSKRILAADVPDRQTAGLLEITPDDKQVINYVQTYWTIIHENIEKLIYFEEFFNSAQGKFIFEKTY
jgi:GntR family transcriptional regulator